MTRKRKTQRKQRSTRRQRTQRNPALVRESQAVVIDRCAAGVLPTAIVIPVSEQLLYMMASMYTGTRYGGSLDEKAISAGYRRKLMTRQFVPPDDVPALLGLSTPDILNVLSAVESTANESIGSGFFERLKVRLKFNPDFYKSVYAAIGIPAKIRDIPIYLIPMGGPTSARLAWPPNRKKVFTDQFNAWAWNKAMPTQQGSNRYGVMFIPPESEGYRGSEELVDYLRQHMQEYLRYESQLLTSRVATLIEDGFKKGTSVSDMRSIVVNCTLRLAPEASFFKADVYPSAMYESDLYMPGPYMDRLIKNVLIEAVCMKAGIMNASLEGMERHELDSAVSRLKSQNRINDIETLVNFIDREDIGLTEDMRQELRELVSDYVQAVNYKTIRAATEDKDAKRALTEFLYMSIPAKPQGCVRNFINADDSQVSAVIFSLYPDFPSEQNLAVKLRVITVTAQFSDVLFFGDALCMGAHHQTLTAGSAIINLFSDVKALSNLVKAAEQRQLSPVCYAFVTVTGGQSNWPRDLKRKTEIKKGFHLSERSHMYKDKTSRTFLLNIGSGGESGAPAVSINHKDGRRLYNYVTGRVKSIEAQKTALPVGEQTIEVKARTADMFTAAETKMAADIRDGRMLRFYADRESELQGMLTALEQSPDGGNAAVEEEAAKLSKMITRGQQKYQALQDAGFAHPFLTLWQLSLFEPPGRPRGGGPAARLAAQAGVVTRGRQYGVKTGVASRTVFVDKPGYRGPSISKLTKFLKDMAVSEAFPLKTREVRPPSVSYDIPKIGRGRKVEDYVALRQLRRQILSDSELQDYTLPTMQHPPLGESEAEKWISKLNPRKDMSRKARKTRRRRTRRNPTTEYRRLMSEHLVGEKTLPERWDASLPEGPFSYSQTPSIFVRKGDAAAELEGASVAKRLGEQPYVRYVKRPSAEEFDSFSEEDIASLANQAGLSLVEARNLARRYTEAAKRRKNTSIPASSALCGANRRPKLKNYRPPPAVMQFPGVSAQRKVFIWISPAGLDHVRVMTFRRNTHIDCDFVSSQTRGQSYGQLLALSIQDTLMWLAQKESRRQNTVCYVGRVGEPNMFIFWSPGQELSYEEALERMKGGSSALVGYDAAADVAAYRRAIGLSGSPPPPTKETPPDLPPPPGEKKEDDEGGDGGGSDGGGDEGKGPPDDSDFEGGW